MTTRVAINGFGRIGRSVLRILIERNIPDLKVVAINDLADDDVLAYLLAYDSVMGRLEQEVTLAEGVMTAGRHRVHMLCESRPAGLPWADLGIDVVVESTGVFRTRQALTGHLEAGARRVILTVPPKDPLDLTVVLGVNDHLLEPEAELISNASCTTNCLAPIAKILHDRYRIRAGLMTTVHAYTNDQRLADVPHADLRRSRAATENIIPTTTGAARAVGTVLPELAGRLDGMAMRVPVADGSIVDLVVQLDEPITADGLNQTVQQAAAGPFAGIVEYTEAPVVSSDIIGNPHSSVFDAAGTAVLGPNLAKVLAWYDNEWGYSNRVVDLIERLMGLAA